MAGRNGAVAGVLDLGDLTAEKKPLTVTRGDPPVSVEVWGYVAGRRCPGRVQSAISAANARWREIALNDALPLYEKEAAFAEHLCDTLMAVIDGLEYQEAEVLTGDTEKVFRVLRMLGWRDDEQEAPDDSPEASGAESPSTTEASSPS